MNKSIANLLRFSIFISLLFGCSNQESQSTPTSTLLPSATVIPTRTEQMPTQIPTKALRPTVTPYPIKELILDYYLSGYPLPFEDLLDAKYPILVLYSDRQIIVTTGQTFQQKILTEDEMHQFLSHINNLGFYRIESNQTNDQTDKLYDFGRNYQFEEIGFSYCVVTTQESRKLCAYEPYKIFLVPEMKNVLYFLDRYKPGGLTPYQPDRILLEVHIGRDPYVQNLPHKTIPWSDHFPSLESANDGLLYVEGKAASELYSLLSSERIRKVAIQNGTEYSIEVFRPVLPHEVISFP